MISKGIFALVFLTISFQVAYAEQHGGTDQDEKACIRDVTRFCRRLMNQGDFAILACLQQHRTRLRPACRKVLAGHGV
jgi:hypothetical protein